jgi:hypothetical protein
MNVKTWAFYAGTGSYLASPKVLMNFYPSKFGNDQWPDNMGKYTVLGKVADET